jgi:hypothetical protein
MNKNFKNTKAYRDYLSSSLDDMDHGYSRGDDWSGHLYNNLGQYYGQNEDMSLKNLEVDEYIGEEDE